MSISPAARALVAASVSSGRLRSRERSVIPCCGICSPTVGIWGLSPKSGEAALARIPFLADLILDRQAGRGGGAVLSSSARRGPRSERPLKRLGPGRSAGAPRRKDSCHAHRRAFGTLPGG